MRWLHANSDQRSPRGESSCQGSHNPCPSLPQVQNNAGLFGKHLHKLNKDNDFALFFIQIKINGAKIILQLTFTTLHVR